MAKNVHVEQPFTMDPVDVKTKMATVLADMASKYGLSIDWQSDTKVTIKRSGVKGWAEIGQGSVVVDLDLSFPVSAMAGKVKEQLEHKMSKELS